MKKSLKVALISVFLVSTSVPAVVFANEIGDVVTPTGIMVLVVITPLIIVLVLLLMKVGMIIAGLVDDVLAMLIGGIGLEETNKQMLEAIPMMLGITVSIISSAVAMAIFKASSCSTALTLAKRGTEGKVEYASAFTVILLAATTYMSGIGGGSTMVIVPLAFTAADVVPELITVMSLAAAVSFTTSPTLLKSSIAPKLGDISVGSYVLTVRPYWLFLVALAIVLAFWGTKHRNVGFRESADDELGKKSNGKLFRTTLPAIFLLFAVTFGSIVNDLVGFTFFTPFVYTILTLVLIFLCTDFSMNKSVEVMVDGSIYVLIHLFQVGIFSAFINVITQIGAFTIIAGVTENAPAFIIVPAAILVGTLIGIPAGAYAGFVSTSVLSVAVSLNFPPLALGSVAMGAGLGSQMSFVNTTMQALSSGFQTSILGTVKGNMKWLSVASVLLLVIGLILEQKTI